MSENLGAFSVEQSMDTSTGEIAPQPEAEVIEAAPEAEAAPEQVEEVKQPEVKKEEDLFSKKFAALSKKEKQIRQREAQLNAKMAELESKLKGLEPKAEPKKPNIPLERRLKENPLEALKEMGLSYEKLTELALNDGKVSVEDRLELMREQLEERHRSEIEAIRNELMEKEKKVEEERYKEVIQNFMGELTSFVNNNADYELIRANDAVPLVYEVIQQHHAKTGRILSNEDAANHVESHLLEEAKKLLKLKKLGYKEEPKVEKKPAPQPAAPTLSNSNSTVLSNKVGVEVKSDAELKKIAASMLKWS